MLKSMRDSFHHLKWILLGVVAAFVFGFVFISMGLGGAGERDQRDNTYAAKVNGDTITRREYDRALGYRMRYYEQMAQGRSITPEMMAMMGVPKQTLDSLIDQRLLLQQADRLQLTATPAEVRKQILEIPILNPNGQFVGRDLYTNYLVANGFTSPAEFENELAKDITMRKLESALSNSLVISPKAAEAEYRRMTENARIKYVVLPVERGMASVTVTPAEVEQFYKQNQAKYTHGEQKAVKYLVADLNRIRQTIQPSDADLRKEYEASKEKFKQAESAHVFHILVKVDPQATPEVVAAAKAKAESLVKQLRAGADFGKIAKENSQDPGSASNGGDMSWVEHNGGTVKPFEDAVFSVPLNTISDPIRSPEFGFHIIKVTERRPAGYRPFEEARPQIVYQVTDQLAKDRATNEINSIAAKLRQAKPKSPADFTKFATSTVSSNDTQWFAKGDAVPGLGNNPTLMTWAFTANKGDVGEPIGTQRGPAIPYLYDSRNAGVSAFDEVKAKVENDARAAKARELVRTQMQTALPTPSVDELAKKLGLVAQDTTVTRQGFISGFKGDTTALVDAAMSAPVGEVKGPIAMNEGAVVFQVIEQKKVDPKELADNKASYAERLRQQEANSLRTVLVQRLRKAAKIVINDQLLAEMNKTQQAGL